LRRLLQLLLGLLRIVRLLLLLVKLGLCSNGRRNVRCARYRQILSRRRPKGQLLLLELLRGILGRDGGDLRGLTREALRLRAGHLVGKIAWVPLAGLDTTGDRVGMLQLRNIGGMGAGSSAIVVEIHQVLRWRWWRGLRMGLKGFAS
jgi:hypothetical protein